MGLLSSIRRTFKKAVKSVIKPIRRSVQSVVSLLVPNVPEAPRIEMPQQDTSAIDALTKAIAAGPPGIDKARLRLEQSDSIRRKRGRRASILTGATGVGSTPIGQRTLIGS